MHNINGRSGLIAAFVIILLFMGLAPSGAEAAPDSGSGDFGLMTVADILQRNPAAHVVGPNAVEITKGVILRLPQSGESTAPQASCAYYQLCAWEHSYWDGPGYEIDFYYCGDYDLRRLHYPDGAWDQPGPQWNDRISSMSNNQTTGTWSRFFDVTGWGTWDLVFDTTAYDRRDNLTLDFGYDGANMNDRIDRIIPC